MSIFKKFTATKEKKLFRLRIHSLETNLPLHTEFSLNIKRGNKFEKLIKSNTNTKTKTLLYFDHLYTLTMFIKNQNFLKKLLRFSLKHPNGKAKAKLDISKILNSS